MREIEKLLLFPLYNAYIIFEPDVFVVVLVNLPGGLLSPRRATNIAKTPKQFSTPKT